MSQIEKLFEKIEKNPKNVRYEQLDKILRHFGFGVREPKSGSSHVTYFHPKLADILTVPKDKPFVKEIYVKKALKMIQDIRYYD
ncbi:type II toxin-antitoxin system HicA family toxin [Thermoanaerobacterium thermosulfurigenes]|uniref:type II toxin-antitoxin system HicA family toxin n=1 Tax=Thermoanaerobacterium thermosulfurigenes TaxID=33950 RepID=UPI003EF0F860